MLKIFSGNANTPLAHEICQYTEVPLGEAHVGKFPDGETFVEICENIRGKDVFIIQPTNAPANDHLMELLIFIDAAKRASAARITAVIPFYGYSRQDRKDKPRVPITAKLVANLLVTAGADRIVGVDFHSQQLSGFFDIPVDHLFAASVFYKYFKAYDKGNWTVCAPDAGSMKMASAYANMLGCPLGMIAKRRKNTIDVEAMNVIGEVDGREILLVDDMVETAGTVTAAAKLLKSKGALCVRAAVSHGVINPLGYERLKEDYIDELVTTNTTAYNDQGLNIVRLSVAKMLAEAIVSIHDNASVSSLFTIKGY